MSQSVEVVLAYFNAVAKGDFETVGNLFADDAQWHQPGKGSKEPIKAKVKSLIILAILPIGATEHLL